jgi:hypothetical protein
MAIGGSEGNGFNAWGRAGFRLRIRERSRCNATSNFATQHFNEHLATQHPGLL